MTTVPRIADHLQAVIDCLDLFGHGRWHVGDGVAPKDDTGATYPPPYMGVHLISDTTTGPANDPDADVTVTLQVTCVAESQLEAAWLRDKATEALTTTPVTVAGRTGMYGSSGIRPAGGRRAVERSDEQQPSLFYATPLFTLTTTPTS